MKRHSVTLAVGAFVAVWLCGTACGAPSMLGPTGALVTPDAEVVGRGALDLGAHFADGTLPFVGEGDFAAYKGTVGLSDRLEITGAFISVEQSVPANGEPLHQGVGARQGAPASTDTDELTVHAKYQLISRPDSGFSVAVGVIDMFESLLSDNIWYGAITRTVGDAEAGERLLRATAGVALANGIGGGGDDTEFYASLEAEVNDVITVVVDHFSDDFSFGARARIGNHLNADIASIEADNDRELLLGGGVHLSW